MRSINQLANQVDTAMQQPSPGAIVTNEHSEAKASKSSTLLKTKLDKVYQYCLTNLRPVLIEYWPEFANKYPDIEMQKWVIREYAKQMVDEGIASSALVKNGIAKACKCKYRPRPTEFAKLCKPSAEELGLPSLRDAYDEVITRRGKFKNRKFEFSHRIVELIDERIGFKLYQMRDSAFSDLFKGEFEYWVSRYMTADLPEPRKALEYTPPTKAKIDSYVSKHGLPQLGSDLLSQKITELGLAVKQNRQAHISTTDDKVA